MSKPKAPAPLELDVADLAPLLERLKPAVVEEDYRTIEALVATLLHVASLLEKTKVSVQRLKKLLFGLRTEKTRDVLPQPPPAPAPEPTSDPAPEPPPKGKRKGHGRNGADRYTGATRISVTHPSLRPGNPCPAGCQGRLYRITTPVTLVRFRSKPPLDPSVYELEPWRCSLCGTVFTAPAPEEAGDQKYDETARAMLGLLRYGTGLPLNRLEQLQESLGAPVPSSTQWDILEANDTDLKPLFPELIRQAAQGDVFHNDDTPMKVLELMGKRASDQAAAVAAAGLEPIKKRSVFTSGIIALLATGVRIALFFTGPKHAGENLATVLTHRAQALRDAIQMCDALSRNLPAAFRTLLANCLAHGRRQFVDVVAHFPDQCRYVLETLAQVYRNDELATQRGLGPEERLHFHQEHSGPLMEKLREWFLEQRETKNVEPNSGLGQAIAYMLRHWDKLTLFLREPGAPLDNNLCERALKKAILHRKNSLFYKSEHGAQVGDLHMSLIHTCTLNGVNPFHYLTEVLRHREELRAAPADWIPWTYRETLQRLAQPDAVAA